MFQKACTDADMPLVQQVNMPRFPLLSSLPDWVGYLVHIWFAISLAVIVPVVLATLFGYAAFQRRIKGVYFSLITQALLLAFFTLTDSNLPYTGGRVGMPYLPRLKLFDHEFQMLDQYYLTAGMLSVCFLVSLALVRSKFGKVLTAIRDSEYRVLALGYNTAMYKTFIFAYAAALAGIAGALYVSASADGRSGCHAARLFDRDSHSGGGRRPRHALRSHHRGRARQLGKTIINDKFATYWPVMLGLLFVFVTLFLPNGILGGLRSIFRRWLVQGDKKSLAARLLHERCSHDHASSNNHATDGKLLEVEDLTVSFSGFKAINNLNFSLRRGELRVVIGPNGAGKTTLLDVITGKTRPQDRSTSG